MICPNYKIKEVFDGFNEVVVALGGKPMTEEEFRSSELRNLRTGRDYSAMEAAYKMYHRNNGNMPDVAPNGKHSILFDSLLKYFNGDRKAAIKAKSNVYTNEFFSWFGDWENGLSINQDNNSFYRGQFDEPYIDDNGNLILYGRKDSLYEKAGYKESKGVSVTRNLKSAIEYGEGQFETRANLVMDNSMDESEQNAVIDNGYYLIQFKDSISNKEIKEAGESKLVGDITVPKGSYAIEHYVQGELVETIGNINNPNVSKVVDENGEPLAVYHTSSLLGDPNFDTFDTKIKGVESAIYATDSYDMSTSYMDPEFAEFTLLEKEERSTYIPFLIENLSQDYPDINWNNFNYESLPSDIKEDKYVLELNYLMYLNDVNPDVVKNNLNEYLSSIIEIPINRGDHFEYIYRVNKTRFTKILFYNIKNPLVVDAEFNDWNRIPSQLIFDIITVRDPNSSNFGTLKPEFVNKVDALYIETNDGLEKRSVLSTRRIEDAFRNSQYDGAIIKRVKDYGSSSRYRPAATVVFAYNPNQVKSAVKNSEFSKTNDNIYKNKGLSDNERIALYNIAANIKQEIESSYEATHWRDFSKETKDRYRKLYKERIERAAPIMTVKFHYDEDSKNLRVYTYSKDNKDLNDFLEVLGLTNTTKYNTSEDHLEQVLQFLLYQTRGATYNIQDVVKILKIALKGRNIRFKLVTNLDDDQAAYYDDSSDTIYINERAAFKNEFGFSNRVALTILHELLHSATVYSIKHSPELQLKLLALLNEVKTKLGPHAKDYGLTDIYEFLAELSNKEFIDRLSKIKTNSEKKQYLPERGILYRVTEIIRLAINKLLRSVNQNNRGTAYADAVELLMQSIFPRGYNIDISGPAIDDKTKFMASAQPADKIRKSAENIRHRFGVLYKTYEKMPNKSASRQKLANEIFEMYGKIKRLDNFDAVTNAMEFAKVKLGLKDDSKDGVLQWLEKNEVNNFENVSPELIVDVMQNSIGFFKDLLTYFPPDSYMTEDAINTRNNILGSINGGIFLLWSKAVYAVSDRVIDLMVDRWFTGQDEDREGMKEVAKDWLHKNMMYGDISGASAFLQNYQYSENPIVKQIFHLILVAETKTGMELLPISAKISKAYIKANKDFGKLNPSWLKIFMEFDKNGIPTGNFVRDINYGQYQKDLDEFINNLNDEFNDKYGHSYYIDEDGTFINSLTGGFADDEEWVGGVAPHIIEYKLRIEEFKCERSNRRYTYEYYKERMSEPYSGPDPSLTHLTGNFKHGLSPRTLSKYNRIQSNINYYMSLCYNKESGSSHPENLTDQDWIKLESFRKELETLSNPYKEDGTIKSGEDYQTAIEIRAWEKWIGEKLDTQVDVDKFEQEANEILNTRGIDAYNKFIKYNSRVSINPNLISLTLKSYGLSDVYAEAVHARLLRTSLLKLVQSKTGYTRDLSLQEENPQFWQECKSTDQIIEDHRVKRGKDFALMMENTFSDELIPYRDAYGNAYDLSGNIVPRDKEKSTPLMSYYDHMIYKYTSIILSSPTRTINGLYDRVHGGLYVFRGTDDQVKNQVMLLFTYRRVIHHEDGSTEIVRLPLSIFSMLTPKDEWFVNYRTGKSERSITNVPSGRFSTKYDTTFKYMSDPKDYDYNSPIAEQPKLDYYDNKEAFDKIKGSAKELYDILTETCKNTQLLYRLNGFLFNYRLPMINALSMALLSRLKSDGYRNVSRAIFDAITTIEENDENMRTSSLFPTNPDGTVATDIPLRFVKPLEDMSRLSTDISSMVILFAEMGLNYKNKQQINNQVKAIRYNMDKDVRDQLQRLSDEDYTTKENENSVDLFDNMTSIHLYGNDWHFKKESNKPYDRATVAFLKAARFVQRYETTHMLGLNILSMLVGACDAGVKLFREVLNGKYARPSDMVKGFIRCIEHTPKAIANIGCPLANNKFTALMQLFRISKGTRATYEHMNWGRLHKVSAQLLMGGFSMLDYMMNGLLLMTHMSNVRFYEGDSDVKAGFYTLYELQLQFIKAGRSKSDATLKHLFLHVDLYNAFDFDSEEGVCHIKPLYELYVTDDIATQIRTKTMSRGALYNGMNPDNDQPKARKKVWSAIILSMRGWLTLAYLHLVSGGTDNIPISEEQHVQYLTRYGITKQFKFSAVKGLTNEERARRLSWNYETGTPQDQILVGLARAFKTSWRYCITNMFRNIPEGDPAKVKFSYVEKYAVRDSIIYLAVLSLMLATFPLINNAAGDVPPPNEDDPKFLDDPYHYMKDIFIPNEYYKLMIADIYFRTIESSISSVDPTTALDFITSATVLYSAYKELAEFVQAMIDAAGLGDGTIHDTVNRGGYKHYTKFTRAFAKGTGFLDNIHTAFDFYGLDNNLKFYLGKYGGIYRFLGYDYKRKYGKDIVGSSYTPSMFGSKPSLGPKPSLGGKPSLGQKPKL